jgi:hypothetical protein
LKARHDGLAARVRPGGLAKLARGPQGTFARMRREDAKMPWNFRAAALGPAAIRRIACLGTAIAVAALASASDAAAPKTISGASPFGPLANCGNFPGDPADNPIVYLNSEVEPFLAVNPADPSNLIAVFQQDRWSNGGARGNAFSRSTNGGTTWSAPAGLPKVTTCTAGPWERATDPWVTFSPNGTAYAMSLVFQSLPPPDRPGGDGANAMLVQRSMDGGAGWSDPIELIRDVDPRFFNDKNAITADPTDSNYVYSVWDRLSVPAGVTINPENLFGLGFKGPAYFTRTLDGGASWEPARAIYDPAANNQTIGNQIAVLPSGTVLNFFNEILNFKNADGGAQFDFNLSFISSTDKGATWKPSGQANRVQKIQSLALFPPDFNGVDTPDTNEPVRTGDILFDVAVDPRSGTSTIYAVWQDARFSGFQIDQIALSASLNGGRTWSAPIKINQTPTTPTLRRQQAFTPSVEVTGSGKVVVTYYDFRNDDGTGEFADYFGLSCTANCQSAFAWVPANEIRLTQRSFEIRNAPFARGYFTGDYEGLATNATDGLSIWSQPVGSDPGDILFLRF